MKLLLIGKTGLLGNALFTVLSNHYSIIAPGRAECDISNLEQLKKYISKTGPDIVVDAAGYTDVDKAEQDRSSAFSINAEGAKNLICAIAPLKCPLVHFSTDYVFDGKKSGGYLETDSPSPISVYGASKAAGEKYLIASSAPFYLIRTAWLFGAGGKNFVDAVLHLAREKKGEPLKIVNDQRGSPTFTFDLADAVLRLLKTKSYGIYHIVNEGSATWYEFANEIFTQLGIPQKILPIASAELGPNRAPRPQISILLNTKLEKLRPWKEALNAYLLNKVLIL